MDLLKMKKGLCRYKILALACLLLLNAGAYSQIFIEAENYSNMAGIQTQGTSDAGGGLNVGWIDANDWMEYAINISVAGDYVFGFRVASLNGGGEIEVLSNGTSLQKTAITATGGWQNWQTISSINISLTDGEQTIRLKASKGGFNINWFEIKLVSPVDNNGPTAPIIIEHSSDVHNINLCWTSATDAESAVSGYKIYNGSNFLAFSTDTCFSLSKLAPETAFDLKIYAYDLAGNSSSAASQTISTTAITWDLLWADEFDGTAVDRTKWNFQTGGGGWGNGEAQYYTDGPNSSVANGFLSIEARKETIGSNKYTSSRMNTSGKVDFLYGRIEVRAKLPKTKGTWPAIWTLPTNWVYGGWPDCGEIDIMEHSATYNFGNVFGTIHTAAYNHQDGTQIGGGVTFPDVADAFHTYALEWYPSHLDWYYDDVLVFSYQNEYKTYAEWPFDVKHHLLLNVAIGGGLGGSIDDNGVWPQQMVVDYVRIYDFNLGANDTIAPSGPTNLKATPGGVFVNLSWDQATDNEFVKGYYIFKNNVLIDSVSGGAYKAVGLEPFTEYTFSVQANDFGGNVSDTVSIEVTTTDVESFKVPGKFQAEDFLYMEGVQTENCDDTGGGLNVAYISVNDWMEYSIDVQQAGTYYIAVRVAAQSAKGSFQLLDNAGNVLTTVATPSTGAWQKWVTVLSEPFELNAGIQRITIKSLAKDYNINWFEITDDPSKYTSTPALTGKIAAIYPNPLTGNSLTIDLNENAVRLNASVSTMDGKVLFKNQFNNVENSITINNLNLNPGIYIVSITVGSSTNNFKLLAK